MTIVNDEFLAIDTQTGMATRYVRTRLPGMRIREAGVVKIEAYNAFRRIPLETLHALDDFRRSGSLG